MSPKLIAQQVDVTERGPASRLLKKVDCRKSLLKKGPTEKVRRRRFAGEGPPEKWCSLTLLIIENQRVIFSSYGIRAKKGNKIRV